jgi:pilus assembly protein CpaF
VDARLPAGHRVNAIIPPLALNGPTLTIRKFQKEPFTVDDLIKFGTFTSETAAFLRACVQGRLNIVISGGTGSGKTTTLNVLSSFIPDDERIITMENAAELQLRQDHVVTLESRPPNIEGKGEISIRQLVTNALRMRPDRIVVGEVRSEEALDMLQAMNTGHDGSLTTAHSNSPRDTLSRLETMCLMSGMDLPLRAIREQVASAINLVVHQERIRDGTRRITAITEVQGMEGDVIVLQDIFIFESLGVEDGKVMGELRPTGVRPKFMEQLEELEIYLPPEVFGYDQSFYR